MHRTLRSFLCLAEFLFRSRDRGDSWERISPDLTTNDPKKQKQQQSGGLTVDNSSAENHTTIYSISESPKNAKVIWVGTDDGNLQVTRDGGAHWANVAPNVAGLPRETWVSCVEAGRFDEGTAFASFDGHPKNGTGGALRTPPVLGCADRPDRPASSQTLAALLRQLTHDLFASLNGLALALHRGLLEVLPLAQLGQNP
jgi:hypothetical protein